MTAIPRTCDIFCGGNHPTVIRFDRYRVSCPTCKAVTEAVDSLPMRGPRVPRPLAHLVCELYKVTTHKAVGLLLGLHGERSTTLIRP